MPTFAAFDQEKSELESVLSSGILERAPNLAHLLAYVCSKYFDGAGQQVKEYNIAVEALGRPPDFDQKKDSIVRVEAHKLRKRLREYYQSEGANHPVHIEIPPGQYAPKFIFQHAPAPDPAAPPVDSYLPSLPETLPVEPETLVAVVRKAPTNAIRRTWLGIAAAGVIVLSVVIALALHKKSN